MPKIFQNRASDEEILSLNPEPKIVPKFPTTQTRMKKSPL